MSARPKNKSSVRNVVICCDGTWNRPDAEYPTNVVRLARNLVNDYKTQIVYYHQGVGTGGKFDKLVGGATGLGVKENIHDAYRFLVHNYHDGDRIWLFGFSRGAFTVRSLGGLIYKCGILKRPSDVGIDKAMDRYKTSAHPDDNRRMVQWREANSAARSVWFVGVWDTVGALGVPAGWISKKISEYANGFHDLKINPLVRYAYQALAMDERREAFEPAPWRQSSHADPNQTLEQLWFPGVHSDVGGGYAETGLSDGALDWMQARAQAAGLVFKTQPVYQPKPNPHSSLHDSARDWSMPVADRDITSCDRFHASVRERLTGDGTYQPANLLRDDRCVLMSRLPFLDE